MAWKNCFSTGLYKSFLAEIVWVILNLSKILWVVKNTTGFEGTKEVWCQIKEAHRLLHCSSLVIRSHLFHLNQVLLEGVKEAWCQIKEAHYLLYSLCPLTRIHSFHIHSGN